jgi:DNA-binding NtrC family response regulator
MLTAAGTTEDMVRAIRMGAFHYVVKPPDTQSLRTLIDAAVANRRLQEKVEALAETVRLRDEMESASHAGVRFGRLVGSSAAMRRVFGLIEKVSNSDVPVLVTGESGTGKELVAREIHDQSARSAADFVAVNCASVPGNLLESELFGHRKGAFTGATADREGAFRAADGGTLLLDEIAEMSPDLQSKLLRVLQEELVKPVGEDRPQKVDVRVIAATNQDIDELVETGEFREDLFYRLNVVRIVLPPLRQRPEDIRALAEHFTRKHGSPEAYLTEQTLRKLVARPWPGNVRELENAVRRAIVLSDGPEVDLDSMEIGGGRPGEEGSYDRLWQDLRAGECTHDIKLFADLHGKLALAEMMHRAAQETDTDREAGELLGFIPADDPDDRAFNNYRSWKRRVFKLEQDAQSQPEE